MIEIPTLVLVPGLGCNGDVWSETIGALADVAACQLADISAGASIPEMAEALLAGAPERFALAGHSLGGYVAFEVLRRLKDEGLGNKDPEVAAAVAELLRLKALLPPEDGE